MANSWLLPRRRAERRLLLRMLRCTSKISIQERKQSLRRTPRHLKHTLASQAMVPRLPQIQQNQGNRTASSGSLKGEIWYRSGFSAPDMFGIGRTITSDGYITRTPERSAAWTSLRVRTCSSSRILSTTCIRQNSRPVSGLWQWRPSISVTASTAGSSSYLSAKMCRFTKRLDGD
jgi:hypothetical protein